MEPMNIPLNDETTDVKPPPAVIGICLCDLCLTARSFYDGLLMRPMQQTSVDTYITDAKPEGENIGAYLSH